MILHSFYNYNHHFVNWSCEQKLMAMKIQNELDEINSLE